MVSFLLRPLHGTVKGGKLATPSLIPVLLTALCSSIYITTLLEPGVVHGKRCDELLLA